ncbi:hypothetical protein KSP40_PGU011953 [Platanthera guangdongensis]|uniref:Ubiquinol oxidase n=1 Tax=Platanthera guangdongensis TaxID=2320717 RepID=A0ABR2MPR7_9ASPA
MVHAQEGLLPTVLQSRNFAREGGHRFWQCCRIGNAGQRVNLRSDVHERWFIITTFMTATTMSNRASFGAAVAGATGRWNWRFGTGGGMQDRNGGEPALFLLAAGADAANAAGRRFAEELKKLPAVQVAVDYYMNEDMYLFDEFQTSRTPNSRRPKIENLYDVFLNVRDDEGEHCKTMKACQTHGNLRSPHSNAGSPQDVECAVPTADCEGFVDCFKKSLADRK